jgi:hypothetical protein
MLMVVMSHGPRVKMFISILEQGRNPFMNKWMMPKNLNQNIKMFILGLDFRTRKNPIREQGDDA